MTLLRHLNSFLHRVNYLRKGIFLFEKTILLIFVFCALPVLFPAYGQSVRIKVVDASSLTELRYANVGVPGTNVGGITDEKGIIVINLASLKLHDSLAVSYLGYQSKKIGRDGLNPGTMEVKLIPTAYQLREVVALGKRPVIIVGNNKHSSRHTGWGDYKSHRGRSKGTSISSDDFPVLLTKFVMRLHENTFDSVRIRIHILSLNDSNPGLDDNEMLAKNLFMTCKKGQKWVSIDLTPYNIVATTKFVVVAEWVDSWSEPKKLTQESDILTIAVAKKEGDFYQRGVNEVSFRITRENFTPTMYFESYKFP